MVRCRSWSVRWFKEWDKILFYLLLCSSKESDLDKGFGPSLISNIYSILFKLSINGLEPSFCYQMLCLNPVEFSLLCSLEDSDLDSDSTSLAIGIVSKIFGMISHNESFLWGGSF